MAQTIVAKRYAKALFELAQEKNQVEQVEQQLELIVSAVTGDQDIEKFLLHPQIAAEDKMAVLTKATSEQASEMVLNTLQLLITRGRAGLLSSLYQYFVDISNEATGQALAVVTTPQAMTETESDRIAQKFSAIVGKKIRVDNVVDPSMIGGLTVRIGDRLYDGSLAGKIATMKKTLHASQVI